MKTAIIIFLGLFAYAVLGYVTFVLCETFELHDAWEDKEFLLVADMLLWPFIACFLIPIGICKLLFPLVKFIGDKLCVFPIILITFLQTISKREDKK